MRGTRVRVHPRVLLKRGEYCDVVQRRSEVLRFCTESDSHVWYRVPRGIYLDKDLNSFCFFAYSYEYVSALCM